MKLNRKVNLSGLSILVTSFNKIDFIENFARLVRILETTGAEICLVDDASTDGSSNILREIVHRHDSIRSSLLEKNIGSAGARNLCISMSTKPFLFFLDIDDSLEIENLSKCLELIQSSGADLLVANLLVLPSQTTLRMPLAVSSPKVCNVRDLTFDLSEVMGYSRIIYSREFVNKSQVKFFPTREENSGAYFILDDAFWLLQLGATNAKVVITKEDDILYYYYPPESNEAGWRTYIGQLLNAPNLVRIFLNKSKNNPNLDQAFLTETSINWLLQTLQPLTFSQLHKSGIFQFVLNNRANIGRDSLRLSHFSKALRLTLNSFKNSINIRKRIRIGIKP